LGSMRTELLQLSSSRAPPTALAGSGAVHEQPLAAASAASWAHAGIGAATSALLQLNAGHIFGWRPPIDCNMYPLFCDARMNCLSEPLQEQELRSLDKRIATTDGHANLRLWCMARRRYASPLKKCLLDGDIAGYAHEMFALQDAENMNTNRDLLAMDAEYCFGAGHCNDTEVSLKTSLRDAEGICDRKFGRERWTGVSWRTVRELLKWARDMPSAEDRMVRDGEEGRHGTTTPPPPGSPQAMMLQRSRAELAALVSCAMGNYHCDVAYCRNRYCADAKYRALFGNLTWRGSPGAGTPSTGRRR